MPKSTFENLPQEKQNRLIQVALKEFALNDFQTASITRIVKKLGIAKGSIYQYFKDKKDLYFHLIEVCKNQKILYMQPIMVRQHDDFWDMYRELLVAGLQFDIECPLHSGFLYSVSQERNSEALGNLMLEHKKQGMIMLKGLMQHAVDQGNLTLREDLSIDWMAYAFVQVSSGLLDYLEIRYALDFRSRMEQHQPILGINKKELLEVAEDMIRFLQQGITPTIK